MTKNVLLVIAAAVAAAVVLVRWQRRRMVNAQYRIGLDLLAEMETVAGPVLRGETPDPAALERFAADSRTRIELFGFLLHHKRLALFPGAFRTPVALAEGELVRWLLHPNELGAAPTAIELAEAVDLDPSPSGMTTWLVFRFRGRDGAWLAGAAGPVAMHSKEPYPPDAAWSQLHAFDSASARDHA